MSFPRYPKYKATHVNWLAEIPEHWVMGRLRYLSDLLVDGTHHSPASNVSGDHLYITAKNIKEHGFDLTEITYVSAEDHGEIYSRCPVAKGDVLYIKDGATAGIAMVNHLEEEFSMLSSVALIRPKSSRLIPQFVAHHLNAGQFKSDVLNRLVGGAMTRFTLDLISRFVFTIPTHAEQTAIAAFLDRETAKIDALVAEQQRLIELLAEKRKAVISHAVTKGLNPTAPLKPSGNPWLGDIPEHWGVVQSRRLFRVRNEPALPEDDQLTASQKYGMIPQSEFVEREGRRVVEIIKGTDSLRHAEPNDFIISLRSFQGGIEWCKLSGSVTFHYVVLVPIKHVHPAFFAQLFKSEAFIQALRSTTNLIRDGQDLRYSHFVLLDLPVIPLDEQAAIAEFLSRETAQFDTLAIEAQRTIDLLQERRTALISAAVTGQIDVRNTLNKEAA